MEIKSLEQQKREAIANLQEFVDSCQKVREWKRGEAVRLRVLGFSYQEIQTRLRVSISFIAKNQKKFWEQGIEGLKLGYKGSKSYLTKLQQQEVMEWLSLPERRNISELERHLMETYSVVFKSRESYYQLLKKKPKLAERKQRKYSKRPR